MWRAIEEHEKCMTRKLKTQTPLRTCGSGKPQRKFACGRDEDGDRYLIDSLTDFQELREGSTMCAANTEDATDEASEVFNYTPSQKTHMSGSGYLVGRGVVLA